VKLGVTMAATLDAPIHVTWRDVTAEPTAFYVSHSPLSGLCPWRLAGLRVVSGRCLAIGWRTRLPHYGYRREWRWRPCGIFRVVATGTTIARRTLEKVGARLSVQCYGHNYMLAPEPKSGQDGRSGPSWPSKTLTCFSLHFFFLKSNTFTNPM
jgi:hypothetical protein